MDKKIFGDLAFGTRFIFYGKTYTKIALNMAEDEKRSGNISQTGTEVEPVECDSRTGILDLVNVLAEHRPARKARLAKEKTTPPFQRSS